MGKDGGRSKLEVIRDILVILTCLIVIVSIAAVGMLALRYGPPVYKTVSTVYGALNDLSTKLAPAGQTLNEFISTGSGTASSSDLCKYLLDAQTAFTSGDSLTASKKLDSAEAEAKSQGLTKVVSLIGDVKTAVENGNAFGVLSARQELNSELDCE